MCALFQVGPFLQQPILWKKCTVLSFLSPCRVLDQSSSLFLGFWTHSSSPACARAHSQWPSLPERWAINQSPKIHGIRVWTRDTTPTCGSSSSSQVFLFFSMSYNKICIIKSTTFSFSKISIIFTSQNNYLGHLIGVKNDVSTWVHFHLYCNDSGRKDSFTISFPETCTCMTKAFFLKQWGDFTGLHGFVDPGPHHCLKHPV